MEGNSTESETTSIRAETLTQNCDEKVEDSKNSQGADESTRSDGEEEVMMKGEEDPSIIGDEEALQQEVVNATNTQRDDEDSLLRSHLSTEEQMSATSVSSHPSITQNQPSDPCWYCLRSLDSDPQTKVTELEDSDPAPTLSSGGQTVSYQTDPRPHFGVAYSSRSTCRPLWGSEGPCWGQRNQERPHQTHTCPHCHLELPPDTLSWHEAKCLLFDGLRSLKQ